MAKVQHVSKASSDELLRKFAELDADPPRPSAHLPRGPITIRKESRRSFPALSVRGLSSGDDISAAVSQSPRGRRCRSGGGLTEWKSLLPVSNCSRPASLLRGMDATRIGLFLAASFGKTWRKTVEGASKMFVEKHSQKHVRLISDMV